MAKNLDLFKSIRRFLSSVVDSNPSYPVFRLRDLQAFMKNESSLGTCRTYLYMLSRIGFVETTSNGSYRVMQLIPDNFTASTLRTIYAQHANSPEIIVTSKTVSVFGPLKDFLISLPKARPLDEVFTLAEVQTMINPSLDKSKNASISHYIGLLCKARYLKRIDAKLYELIEPIPNDLTTFKLRELSDKAEPLENNSRASKLYSVVIEFLLELEASGRDEFTRQELVSYVEQKGYANDRSKLSNYISNLKHTGHLELLWPKQYRLLKTPFKG